MSVCKEKYCVFVAENGGCKFNGYCAVKEANLNYSEATVAKIHAAEQARKEAEAAKKAEEAKREKARLVFANIFQRGNGCMAEIATEKTK